MSDSLEQLPDLGYMGVSMFDPIWGSKFHRSGKAELITVLNGQLHLEFEDQSHHLTSGDLALVPPGTNHRDGFAPTESPELFMTHFSWDGNDAFFQHVDTPKLQSLGDYQKKALLKMVGQLRDASPTDDPLEKNLARSLFHTLLLTMLKFVRDLEGNAVDAEEGLSRQKRLMLEGKRYLDEHYDEIITLETMAEKLDVSPYYLSRIFSQESGFSLVSYLTSIRMDRAMDMLKHERMPVAEVAESVGYENSGYFSKVFKNYFGVVPSSIGIDPPPPKR